MKKWPEAAAALDKYQQLAPTDVRPELYQLAFEIYFEAGQDDKAKAALAKITDPKAKAELAPRVYNSGVAKNKEGDVDGAVERFKLAAELDPNFEQAHQNIAAIEFNRQNYKEALVYIDKLLKAKPDSVEGSAHAVLLAARAGRRPRMKSALQAYVAKAPQRRRGGREDRRRGLRQRQHGVGDQDARGAARGQARRRGRALPSGPRAGVGGRERDREDAPAAVHRDGAQPSRRQGGEADDGGALIPIPQSRI